VALFFSLAQMRVVPEEQYAKALLRDGRLIGAVLIGDTDLEEVRTVLLSPSVCVWGAGCCVFDEIDGLVTRWPGVLVVSWRPGG
jgi:hypothetical protein